VDDIEIKSWYYWPFHIKSGACNMQTDHFLAREMYRNLDKPLLRFYAWTPFCISLGYHQNALDVNHDLCQKRGIDLVRRPTGGRAILHATELTYSVIYPFTGIDVTTIYRLIHLPFVKALQNIGIPAEFKSAQIDLRKAYKTDQAILCFATSAKYEVEIAGKKLIGSAQRIYKKAILQHGSVLLGSEHENVVEFLKMNERSKQMMKRYIKSHTTNIWQYKKEIQASELSNLVKKHFSKSFNIKFITINKNLKLVNALEEQYNRKNFKILISQVA